jgi:Ca2+-binding RTX toxin-like protein
LGVIQFALLGPGPGNIVGNRESNILIGNFGDNLIQGGAGNDTVIGDSGDDVILGGSGNDLLSGDAGWDTVMGGSGNDTLIELEGGTSPGLDTPVSQAVDLVDGGSGADLLLAGASDANTQIRMIGGSGADVFRLFSASGIDTEAGPSLQGFRAFIGDLSIADGIDLSAFKTSSEGTTSLSALSSVSSSNKTLSSGDFTLGLSALYVQGLKASASATAPIYLVGGQSVLVVSVPGATLDSAETLVQAALDRTQTLAQVGSAPYSKSTQAIADSLLPSLGAHDALLDSLFYYGS